MTPRRIAILVLWVIMAASCAAEPETLAFAEISDRPVLRVAVTDAAGLTDPIAEWARDHPTIDVEVVVREIEEHRRVALAEAVVGDDDTAIDDPPEIPDLVVFDGDFAPAITARSRLFVDLRQHGVRPWEHQTVDWRWASGVAPDGAVVAVPIDLDGLALLWRSDLVGEERSGALESLGSWCELIAVGDAHAEATGTAFLPEAESLFEAVVGQSRTRFHDDGALVHDTNPEIRRAWDLSMRALGEAALFSDPCPGLGDVGRIASTLAPGSAEWATAVADDVFAAQIVTSSQLEALDRSSPVPVSTWRVAAVPGVAAGDGGRSVAIRAETEIAALAWDLAATLLAPSVQLRVHEDTGRLPAAHVLYDADRLAETGLVELSRSDVIDTFIDSAAIHVEAESGPESPLIMREFRAAVTRVAAGVQTPRDAWDEAIWRVSQFLG